MEIIIIIITGFTLYILEGEIYRRLWHKGLEAEVKAEPSHAFKGDSCYLQITLQNKKLLPLPWLWVKLHVNTALEFKNVERSKADHVYYNALFCIMGWQRIDRRLNFVCKKRGYYPIRSFDIIGTSIMFNGKHSKSYDSRCALTVYPELVDISEISDMLIRLDGIVASSGFLNPDPFEFSGIREYMPTDSLKDINFKASAHTGTLMANMHAPTVKGEVAIILCMKLLKQNFEEERFEYSISLAASLAEHYIDSGYSVALYSNGLDGATGEPVILSGGVGGGVLSDIYDSLARIGYEKTEATDILMPSEADSAAAVFISPTVDLDILELYKRVRQNYSAARWLFPVMEFDLRLSTPPTEDSELIGIKAK